MMSFLYYTMLVGCVGSILYRNVNPSIYGAPQDAYPGDTSFPEYFSEAFYSNGGAELMAVRTGFIVAYRRPVSATVAKPREEATPIHIADLTRMTAAHQSDDSASRTSSGAPHVSTAEHFHLSRPERRSTPRAVTVVLHF